MREYVTIRERRVDKQMQWQVWAGRRIIFRAGATRDRAIALAATRGYTTFVPGCDPSEGRCYRSQVAA